jgi:MFS family permease
MGLRPDGDVEAADEPGRPVAQATSGEIPAKQALRTRAFWMVLGVVVCFTAAVAAVNIHMVPMLVSRGMEETTAGFAVSLRALISIPAMVSAGWLGDKIGRLVVTAVMVSILGAGSLLLAVGVAPWHLWLAVVLLAGGQGLYPLTWAAVGGLFGRRSYATIRGYIMAAAAVGAMALPAAIGYLFEWRGNYWLPLLIVGVCCAASAAFMLATPRRLN